MSAITHRDHARGRLFQHSRWDSVLVLLAFVQGAVLFALPVLPVIAVSLWWNANTISHNFIHNPFFRSRSLNRLFAAYLSVLLGFPHALWRARHLAHHAETTARIRPTTEMIVQLVLVAFLWTTLGVLLPVFFVTVYLPGWLLGLALCAVQGHYEHARGTVSCYGRLYNWLFFNDGFHAEHHARPGEHWTRLKTSGSQNAQSRWPPVLRWLDVFSLESLERLVLRSKILERFVLRCHRRAFARLLLPLPEIRRVGIVGGGLFPRTAIVLRELLPNAALTVIDLSRENLDTAQHFLPGEITLLNEPFDPRRHQDFDLLVIPLSLRGDRAAIYRSPAAEFVCIHDWIWRRRGESVVVSALLLKRLNLVRP